MGIEKETALKILDGGGLFIGHRITRAPHYRRPAVFRRVDEAGELIYDPLCSSSPVRIAMSLARRGEKRIGMVLRGCEGRSVVEAIKNRQLERDHLILHGAVCSGAVDPKLLYSYCMSRGISGDVTAVSDLNESFEFEFAESGKVKVPKAEIVLEKCFDCRVPEGFRLDSSEDGAFQPAALRRPPSRIRDGSDDLKKLLSGCILCFACRSACAGCFCRECVFDVHLRKELTPWMFHLTRTMHLAGRCTQCGECERVCPVDLPVQAIRKELEEYLGEKYKFEGAGIREEDKLPMLDWSPDD